VSGEAEERSRRQGVTATDKGGKEKRAVFDLPEELRRFENSQNVEMTFTQASPFFFAEA
jgi:hypothetical protein